MRKLYAAILALVLAISSGVAMAGPPSPNPEPCQQGKAGEHNKHCQDQPPPDTCNDGVDNDGDGPQDAADPECQDPNDGVEDGSDVAAGSCNDGEDNDGDGLSDENDPECQDPNDGEEDGSDVPPDTCNDGEDNDGDGLSDENDPECQDPNDGVEDGSDVPPDTCNDGVDNDGDDVTDADDPECQDPNDGVEDGSDQTSDPTCASGGLINEGTLLNSDRDEDGPISGGIHNELEPLLPGPANTAGHEAACAVITAEDLLP